MRAGYFGPEGTFTQEALLVASHGAGLELVPLPTIYDTVMAVHNGTVERALVPIENSLEGSVNATLDSLAMETEDVAILGEVVHPIRHCLIARTELELTDIEVVISHPQASAQCARFIRTRLPGAQVMAGASTAEAVRQVAGHDGPWAALGNRLAAERYGCLVLRAGVEDVTDNETRFVWLGPAGRAARRPGRRRPRRARAVEDRDRVLGDRVRGARAGWSPACRSSPSRGVNLTRIESRPRKQGLGRYMFFCDLEGRDTEPHVAAGLAGAARRTSRCCGCSGRSPPLERPRSAPGGGRRPDRYGSGPATLPPAHGLPSTTRASGVRAAS